MEDVTKRKLIIAGAVLFGILLVALIVFRTTISKGVLEISAPAKTPNNADVIVEVQGQEKDDPLNSFKLKPGETRSLRVHTGRFRVNGSVDNLKSIDIVTVKGASTTKIEVPKGEQRAVKQIASNAKYCPVLFGGKVYSYICQGEGALMKHDSVLGVDDSFMFDAQTFNNLEPVKDGLLGYYTAKDQDQLQYIQPHIGTIRPLALPSDISALFRKERPSITAQKSTGNGGFILAFSELNKLFLFQDISDTQPTEIKLDRGLKLSDRTRKFSITFDSDRIVIMAGVNSEAGEGTVGEYKNDTSSTPLYAIEYDQQGKLIRSFEIGKGIPADSFHRLTHDFYILRRPYGIDFYYLENNKLIPIHNVQDVTSWAIYQSKLYVQAQGTIYEFVPYEQGNFSLQSRFTSGDFTVSELYSLAEGLTFTAFAGRENSAPLNVYQLLPTKQAGNKPAIRTQPSFSGLDTLVQYGLTEEQLNGLTMAFAAYADTAKFRLHGVAALDVQPVSRDPEIDNPVDVINFEANINDEKFYRAKIEYSNLTSIRLYLFDKATGSQVFDSKQVNN